MPDYYYKEPGRRGNFTRGEDRKGNRDGRSPMYPPGTPLGRINLIVEMKHYAMLRAMGGGNATRGARMTVKLASQVLPLWMQDEQKVREVLDLELDGKFKCRQATADALARVLDTLRSWDDGPKSSLPVPLSKRPQAPLVPVAVVEAQEDDDESDGGFTQQELKDMKETLERMEQEDA